MEQRVWFMKSMMKAALTYYREEKRQVAPRKMTLGELNAGNALRLRVRNRKQTQKVQFSPEEKALLRLVKNGQVGALIAHHAPAPEPIFD